MNCFYLKKTIRVAVILTITFFSCIIDLNAQKNDTIATVSEISGVEISDSLNYSRYLWKLLEENYSIKIKDTTIFYSIDYKVEVPDSRYFEHFTGVICVEYKDNISTIFVCNGSFINSNVVNYMIFRPFDFDISAVFVKSKIKKYRKFRKYKIEHYNFLNSFKILENRNKKSKTSTFQFNNRFLSSHEIESVISSKFFNYEVNYFYRKVEFNQFSIINNYSTIWKYKFKNVNAIMSLNIKSNSNSNNYVEKYKIGLETPSSLNDILERNK